MNFKSLFQLSIDNIMSRKKTAIKIMVAFLLIAIVINCFLYVSLSLNDASKTLMRESINKYYIAVYNGTSSTNKVITPEELDKLSQIKGVAETRTYGHLTTRLSRVIVHNDTIEDINDIKTAFIIFHQPNEPTFVDNELSAYNKHRQGSPIIHGRDIEQVGEILVTKSLLQSWGFADNNNNIDETIFNNDISVREQNDRFTILNYVRVVGVIDDYYFNAVYDSAYNKHYGMIAYENTVLDAFNGKAYFYHLYYEEYTDESSILKAVNSINSSLTTKSLLSEDPSISELINQRNVSIRVFLLLGGVLLVAIILSIILALSYIFKRKGAYYGIMKANGITNIDLFMLTFFEIMILNIIALITSWSTSLFMISILGELISLIISHTYIIKPITVALVFTFSGLIGLLLTIVIATASIFWILRQSTCKLLKI